MELFSNDKALNVIILVLIVCFLLQIAGVIDLQMLLEDPVCAAIFLLIIAYVSEKEIVVGLLLALVYVMMKGREVEGFTSTGTVTTSTSVATSTSTSVAAPTSTAAAAPTSTAAAAPTSTAAAAPTSTAAAPTSTAAAAPTSTATTLASLVSTSTGGGHPQHLSEIVQQMNGLYQHR